MDLSVGLDTYVMMTAFLSANVGPAVGVAGEVRGEVFGLNAELRFVVPSRTYARTAPSFAIRSSFAAAPTGEATPLALRWQRLARRIAHMDTAAPV